MLGCADPALGIGIGIGLGDSKFPNSMLDSLDLKIRFSLKCWIVRLVFKKIEKKSHYKKFLFRNILENKLTYYLSVASVDALAIHIRKTRRNRRRFFYNIRKASNIEP